MKYKVAAVVVTLALILGLGVFEQIFIKTTFEEFNSRLDSFIVEEDETYDLKQIKETQEWWEKRHKYLELFLPHNQLIEISITYDKTDRRGIRGYVRAPYRKHYLKKS